MRLFWKGRESSPMSPGSENRSPYNPDSISTSKRPSVENLRRVSKVTNSSIIAHEQQGDYDPANVYVPQRPLLGHRLSQRKPNDNNEVKETVREQSVEKSSEIENTPKAAPLPDKDHASPNKSSMSKGHRIGEAVRGSDGEIWDDASRHLKTVTFDAAPPQINEYEMSTPDLSMVTSGSHAGSDGSEEDEGGELDLSFDPDLSGDRDDSFDASLEDLEKTPVVLPDDWRFMSPDNADDALVNEQEDPFTDHQQERSEQPASDPHSEPSLHESNPERRPLPPLPSMRTAENARPSSGGRLPWPLCSQPISGNQPRDGGLELASTSLEDTLHAMMLNDAERATHSAMEPTNGKYSQAAKESNVTAPDSMPGSMASPRISRESILRDIRSSNSDYDGSSFQLKTSMPGAYEPDVPIPTLEGDDTSVEIKQEEQDDDLFAVPQQGQISHDNAHTEHDDESEYSREEDPRQQNASSDGSAASAVDMAKPDNGQHVTAPLETPRQETSLRPQTPENGEADVSDEFSTPESVVRHSVDEERPAEEENVPIPAATVKASGGKLKTRPSLSKADTAAMAATRRRVSGQAPPPMLSFNDEQQSSNDSQPSASNGMLPELNVPVQDTSRAPKPQRHTSLLKLDIPFSIQEESLGFGLDKEFDRVMETQKVPSSLPILIR